MEVTKNHVIQPSPNCLKKAVKKLAFPGNSCTPSQMQISDLKLTLFGHRFLPLRSPLETGHCFLASVGLRHTFRQRILVLPYLFPNLNQDTSVP